MQPDIDPVETQEWLDALSSVVEEEGTERAAYLLKQLQQKADKKKVPLPHSLHTPYCNSINPEDEPSLPGDPEMDRKIRSIVRWNALAMVMRANSIDPDLGGHISSFSSSATLYEVGFNYFFQGPNESHDGDLIYYQGHTSPGIYARAFVEGRLSEDQLDSFRRETDGHGLSSYPHPKLMPEFWQFPTVSMGLGPIQAIYQAQFMRYLHNREIVAEQNRKVWAFLGDGEMDEPESLGAISLAGREQLDNLIFVINCNLQRLDGPVRGNGKIVQELEGVFRGAGWNVIKVLWGRHWDPLFEKDQEGLLQKRMDECIDGDYQNYKAKGGSYTREHFFGAYPELKEMVAHLSDEQIYHLNRGGHDPHKVFAAYQTAVNHKGQPTVILAKTVKGYGTGLGEAANTAHSLKKLPLEDLKNFRDRFCIPIKDENLESIPYYKPGEDSAEMIYMRQKRASLGGMIPQRRTRSFDLEVPELKEFESILKGSGNREISSTMAFVRILNILTKDKNIGDRIVPIVPDEARTFGMEGMFRQLGIYSSTGQLYEPMDSDKVMYYKEDKKGQILEQGINEAGSHASWIAAATSYSNSNSPMIPFYAFYSMFGFQRTGDLAWASGDLQARGFLIGATAGRTTLNGEGLQHQDGHSHILASTIPNCVSYDPTFGYELAVIIQDGLKRMYKNQENLFYYITTMNENYAMPALPEQEGTVEGIINGLYCLEPSTTSHKASVQLVGCGTILNEIREAAIILRNEFDVNATVWSATSLNELRRNGLDCERFNMLNPSKETKVSWVQKCLGQTNDPVIAATDYMKLYADQIQQFLPNRFMSLGTDGFGRSDTRKALRHHFEVDRHFIVVASLYSLLQEGKISAKTLQQALEKFNINPDKLNPFYA